jgi:chaperone BCS1
MKPKPCTPNPQSPPSAASRSILLLEDVDAAFVGRSAADGTASSSRITFSGLLNAIDGVAAQEGRVLFMTTNHVEKLSEALVRPGRVDVRLEFKLADRQQVSPCLWSCYNSTSGSISSD